MNSKNNKETENKKEKDILKTRVEDFKNNFNISSFEKSIYNIKDKVTAKKILHGIDENVVREISKDKKEPAWMLELRLRALKKYYESSNPIWGPDLTEIKDMNIAVFLKNETDPKKNWEDLPEDIKNTFDRLGIPEAEKEYLAGVSAQYDSEAVYHNVKDLLTKQGAIYMEMHEAVLKHEDLVKKYFAKIIDENLHKYSALHLALWSGGSFVYVPKGVKLYIPIQSYYRLNAPGAGQFEHTLIVAEEDSYVHYIEGCSAPRYNVLNLHAGAVEIHVGKNAHVKFSTVENWSRNMYNLNTKKAIVMENGKIEWVSGSFGSRVSMLYPSSILKGDNSISEYTGITFAGKDQFIDNGCSSIHLGKNTYSTVNTKAITQDNGVSLTRNIVYIDKKAIGSKSNSECESLMLSKESISDTIPVIDSRTDKADIGHEASIGKISDEAIFYLTSRGITEEEAKKLIVRGFAEPISKSLPLEYAVEMNRLIEMELEGANRINDKKLKIK